MKFVLLSDIHADSRSPIARKDDVKDALKAKICFVFNYAIKYKAFILQAGDLSNRSRDWWVLDLFIDLLSEYKVKLFTISGQHDMYMRNIPTVTTMSILEKTKNINILGRKPVKINDINIYGAGWKQKIPKPKGEKNILVVHESISTESLYPGHEYFEPKEFSKINKNYNLILAGDVHRQFLWRNKKRIIVNTGPMIRREGTDYNFHHEPSFFVWDSNTFEIEKIVIPHKPAKEVLTRSHIKDKKEPISNETLEKIINEVKGNSETENVRLTIFNIAKKMKASIRTKKIIAEAMIDES